MRQSARLRAGLWSRSTRSPQGVAKQGRSQRQCPAWRPSCEPRIATMSMKQKIFGVASAAALLVAISAAPASATQYSQNSTPGFTINAGVGPRFDTAVATGTVYPTVGNFNNVTMNGTPQLTAAVIAPFTVIDDSGSGAGWHVTLALPDFADASVPPNVVPAAGAQ